MELLVWTVPRAAQPFRHFHPGEPNAGLDLEMRDQVEFGIAVERFRAEPQNPRKFLRCEEARLRAVTARKRLRFPLREEPCVRWTSPVFDFARALKRARSSYL